MKYSVGDELTLIIEDRFEYHDKIDSFITVTILGIDYDCDDDYAQYLCYIPQYEKIPYKFSTFRIDKAHSKYFNVDPKFIGELGCFITARSPVIKHVKALKGEKCERCKDFFVGVTTTNNSFVCHACKQNPYR